MDENLVFENKRLYKITVIIFLFDHSIIRVYVVSWWRSIKTLLNNVLAREHLTSRRQLHYQWYCIIFEKFWVYDQFCIKILIIIFIFSVPSIHCINVVFGKFTLPNVFLLISFEDVSYFGSTVFTVFTFPLMLNVSIKTVSND